MTATERAKVEEEKRRAAEVAPVVTYPGYNPAGPYTLPLPPKERAPRGVPTSQRQLITEVLRANGHTLQKYGIKRDVASFLLSTPMQLFVLDAFWWIFLEYFHSVDFRAMVERTRRGALATDQDVRTYMGQGPTAAPKRPMRRSDDSSKKVRTAYHDNDTGLPVHLTSLRGRLRDSGDVVRVATPTLTSQNLSKLNSVLGNMTGVAVDSDDEASVTSATSLTYSIRSDITNGTRFSELSAESAATVDGLLRVTNFSTTFPSLAKLHPDARASVVAREQHQLFTRMSSHYAKALQRNAPRHHTIKDAITRVLPDMIAQILFTGFWLSVPYATHLFDLQFQKDVASSTAMWIGGVVKASQPRNWPVHHILDTVYKKPLKRAPSTVRLRRRGSEVAKSSASVGGASATPSARRTSAVGLGKPFASPRNRDGAGAATGRSKERLVDLSGIPHGPEEKASSSATATHSPSAGGAAAVSVPSVLDEEDEFLLTADQRRQRAVEVEVSAMRQDLMRLTTTHTFSQVHYSREARGRADAAGSAPGVPNRTAHVHQLGAQKRTVQVIKEDIDRHYRDNTPWYGNPKHRSRIREQGEASTSKFALSNWSPLLHRFMLSNGNDNRGRPDAIRWTAT